MAPLRMAEASKPWRARSFMAAGVVLAFVVVLGIWVVAHGPGTGRAAAPTPNIGGSAAGSAPALRLVPPPTQRAAEGTAAIPTTPPAHVTWRPYNGVLLPYSSTAGPSTVAANLATGYAHTPTGALLAAVQIDYRHLLAPDWQAVTAAQVVAGAGRAAYVADRSAPAPSAAPPPSTSDATPPAYRQVAGFDVIGYSSAQAVIQVVTVGTDGSYVMVPLTVRWDGHDWQLQLSDEGGDGPEAQSLTSLAGFVAWGAV